MVVNGEINLALPADLLAEHLFDAKLMAECIPGCYDLEEIGSDCYRAVVGVGLAGLKARFNLQVEIVERHKNCIVAITRGEEGGNASQLQAKSIVHLAEVEAGAKTLLRYESEVAVTGRFGRFALGMMKKKVEALAIEFAQNLQSRLELKAGTAAGDKNSD